MYVNCSWPWLMTAGHILSIWADRKMSHFNFQRVATPFLKTAILSWRRQTHVVGGFSGRWDAYACWASVETLKVTHSISVSTDKKEQIKPSSILSCYKNMIQTFLHVTLPRIRKHTGTQGRQRNLTNTQKRHVSTYVSDVAPGYLYSCTSYVLYL